LLAGVPHRISFGSGWLIGGMPGSVEVHSPVTLVMVRVVALATTGAIVNAIAVIATVAGFFNLRFPIMSSPQFDWFHFTAPRPGRAEH
jgi:hypothetical protein